MIILMVFAFFLSLFPFMTPAQAATNRYFGVNIEHAHDSGNLKLFANVYKTARVGSPDHASDGTYPLDAGGNPTKDFGLLLWDGAYLKQTQGSYAVRFQGQATVSVKLGDASFSTPVTYQPSTNVSTGVLRVNSDTTVELKFVGTKRTASSSANTGVTNLTIMRPLSPGSSVSHAQTAMFSQTFKTVIAADFQAKAIRFMDFTATNSKTAEVGWSQRVKPGQQQAQPGGSGYGWQGKGAAWEYVVLMANELDVDAWINIPVSASDDYVAQLARLFKYGSDGTNPYSSLQSNPVYPPLEPGRKLYVEYSNELWNTAGAFAQSNWNKNQAVQETNAGGSNLNYDGAANEWTLAWRRQARRTVQISEKFRQVFGSDMNERVRVVLGWQQGNGTDTAGIMLNFIDNWYNNADGQHVSQPRPVHTYIWGGSAYYSPNNHSPSLTSHNIWSSGSFAVNQWHDPQWTDASYAAAFGLRRTAYEGGPSLDNVGAGESVKAQAWHDDRMRTTVIDHQNFWEQYGGDLLMYFTLGGSSYPSGTSAYYQWEFVSDMHNAVAASPKMQGIQALNQSNKHPAAIGFAAPAWIGGSTWAASSRGWGNPGAGAITLQGNVDPIRWTSYNFRTGAAGTRKVRINYSAAQSAQVDVYLNGINIGTIQTGGTSGSIATFDSANQALSAGLHGIRLLCRQGPVTIHSLALE
jgi:hypothetical protein